ncbi:MAG: hypothetical protein HFG34_03115 [Eubacterium sp.]|nr:hypothetical protein [Eubacterium sp.]
MNEMFEINEILMLFGETSTEYTLRADYSGRGMFGRECIGIVCQDALSMMVDLTEYISTFDVININQKLGRICSDSMGMDTIVYFPDITKS